MIFIVLGGLVLKIRPLLGGLSFRDSIFAPTSPYISNCRHVKTKRSWDLKFAEFLSFNDIYKYT